MEADLRAIAMVRLRGRTPVSSASHIPGLVSGFEHRDLETDRGEIMTCGLSIQNGSKGIRWISVQSALPGQDWRAKQTT